MYIDAFSQTINAFASEHRYLRLREINSSESIFLVFLHALTAFFIILSAVALAFFLRPIMNARQFISRPYEPL